jgi:hypothetical protein
MLIVYEGSVMNLRNIIEFYVDGQSIFFFCDMTDPTDNEGYREWKFEHEEDAKRAFEWIIDCYVNKSKVCNLD